jgi:hypothetical protein
VNQGAIRQDITLEEGTSVESVVLKMNLAAADETKNKAQP